MVYFIRTFDWIFFNFLFETRSVRPKFRIRNSIRFCRLFLFNLFSSSFILLSSLFVSSVYHWLLPLLTCNQGNLMFNLMFTIQFTFKSWLSLEQSNFYIPLKEILLLFIAFPFTFIIVIIVIVISIQCWKCWINCCLFLSIISINLRVNFTNENYGKVKLKKILFSLLSISIFISIDYLLLLSFSLSSLLFLFPSKGLTLLSSTFYYHKIYHSTGSEYIYF